MHASNVKYYYWQEINTVPEKMAGVYAWYFSPEIPQYDVDNFVASIAKMKIDNLTECQLFVRSFLDTHIFRFFKELPYLIEMKGALKPSYSGEIAHQPAISQSLIDRLIANPERLHMIKDVLFKTAPFLASPLYIGMAKSLRVRLKQHKRLIEVYRDSKLLRPQPVEIQDEASIRDHCFAREIALREIPPSRLIVATTELAHSATYDDEHVDIENILNRIHFPLLGRN
jgi:hypothetical protein